MIKTGFEIFFYFEHFYFLFIIYSERVFFFIKIFNVYIY